MSRTSTRVSLRTIAVVLCLLFPASPFVAHAQMGGMGGGMGGGMRRGGPPGGMPRGRGTSPVAMTKERLEQADQLSLILDNQKPLKLSKAQQDSVKRLRKEMRTMQEPLFKQFETLIVDSLSARGPRGGGMRAMLPDTAQRVLARIEYIQDAFRDQGRAQLDSTQRVSLDSIQSVRLEREREKAQKEREKLDAQRRRD
ncbi:MAG: hypothetical protein IBJ03_02140 [Gemmatimonadaceae bacterium]|nr:hypothetical protein [Gemmatimonadaceae bacterium]